MRLAVALPKGPGLFTGPRLNTHWCPLATKILEKRHAQIKLVMEGSFGAMGLYSLLHQMFGHTIAAKICQVDDAPYPRTLAEFQECPRLYDPFSVTLNDFEGLPDVAHVIEDISFNIPAFISPCRPKPTVRVNKKKMQVVSEDSASETSVDDREPRSVTTVAVQMAGKSVKPKPFPEPPLLSSRGSLKRVAAPHSPPNDDRTLKRLRKGLASGALSTSNRPADEEAIEPSTAEVYIPTKRPSALSSPTLAGFDYVVSADKTALHGGYTSSVPRPMAKKTTVLQESITPGAKPRAHNTTIRQTSPVMPVSQPTVPGQAVFQRTSSTETSFPSLKNRFYMNLREEPQPSLTLRGARKDLSSSPPESYLQQSVLGAALTRRIWDHAYGMQESRRAEHGEAQS
jgi:hypothetical protein